MPANVTVRHLTPIDRPWVAGFAVRHWGGDRMVVHGTEYHLSSLPGFCALDGEEPVGLATYHLDDGGCEIVSLDSVRVGQGIGSALVEAVIAAARAHARSRLWLVTTNDNLNALRFYQKRGFTLAALHRNAVDEARRLKPEIPPTGYDGIPIRDEVELELILNGT